MQWLRIAGIVANGASVFTSVQDDLDLRLKARKHPVEVLVIDHVERTTKEN